LARPIRHRIEQSLPRDENKVYQADVVRLFLDTTAPTKEGLFGACGMCRIWLVPVPKFSGIGLQFQRQYASDFSKSINGLKRAPALLLESGTALAIVAGVDCLRILASKG
jgi:hypothetical protein